MTPVMYSDPSGEFAILATILITTLVGAALGFSISLGKQLYDNEFNFEGVNWKEVGISTLLGAAVGAAYGLGATAGAIIAGKAAIASLTVSQSFVLLGSSAGLINFTAGVVAYNIRNTGNDNFNYGEMFLSGIGQAGKGLVAFGAGTFLGSTGFWKPGNISNIGSRVISKQVMLFTPNYYFDSYLSFDGRW